ncbi:MAG TPA: toll/interleukin-1 receptor domain-containing protein [Methanothrix sp.]|nr:toll/interleukin-1 receptor domain-containing protein [Methanothrix sp.]
MISQVYISHSRQDEELAMQLSRALWRVGLDSYSALYNLSPALSLAGRISFGLRNSECLVALITRKGATAPQLCQEIGLACGLDTLVIPLQEEGASLPVLIEHLRPIVFAEGGFADAVGRLIKTFRELSRLEWLKVACPKCGEEMTQYLTPQEEVDEALAGAGWLETVCSYCQNKIRLDARTFEPEQ